MKIYNPFKMEGSYFGAIGITTLAFITQEHGLYFNLTWFVYQPLLFIINLLSIDTISSGTIALLITLTYGFLVGWGIHSIFRFAKRIKGEGK